MTKELPGSAAFHAAAASWRQALAEAAGLKPGRKTLYILSRRDTADALSARLPADALVATSNWQVEQTLRAAGHFVLQIEGLLSLELIAEADRFIQGIVRGWYLHDGIDFTEVNGLSLGNIHEYELLHCRTYATEAFAASRGLAVFVKTILQCRLLLEIVQPVRLRHDIQEPAPRAAVAFAAGEHGVPLDPVPPPDPPAPNQKHAAGLQHAAGLARTFQRRLVRLKWRGLRALHHRRIALRRVTAADLSARRKSAIFLIPYPCLESTQRRLNDRLHHIYQPDDLIPGRASRGAQAAHAALKTTWEKIKAQTDYRDRFRFFGLTDFDCFDGFLTQTIETDFLETLHQAASVEKTFLKRGIQVVLVPFDEPNFARLCVQVAQRMGLAAVVCQHGVFDHSGNSRELMTAQNVAVMGAWDREVVQRQRPDAQVSVVGCLQLDALAAQAAGPRERVQSDAACLRILVLTFATDTFTVQSRSIDSEVYLAGVVEALRPVSTGIHVVFKLHPAESQDRYDAALALLQPPFSQEVATGYRLPQLLADSDLVIAPVSTGVVEALFLGKPVLHFRVSSRPVPHSFDGSGAVITAVDPAELTRHVRQAVNDYQWFHGNYDFDRALQSFGPSDGHAAARVTEMVEAAGKARL